MYQSPGTKQTIPYMSRITTTLSQTRRHFYINMAFCNLIRHKRRSAIAVSVVTFSVITILLVSGFIEWMFWGMRESTINSQLGHIQISRPGYHEAGKADPYAFAQLP